MTVALALAPASSNVSFLRCERRAASLPRVTSAVKEVRSEADGVRIYPTRVGLQLNVAYGGEFASAHLIDPAPRGDPVPAGEFGGCLRKKIDGVNMQEPATGLSFSARRTNEITASRKARPSESVVELVTFQDLAGGHHILDGGTALFEPVQPGVSVELLDREFPCVADAAVHQ